MTSISTSDPVVATTQTSLTLQDLQVCVEIIQAASARGAIKPDEMEVVGQLFTKLVTFLSQAGAYTASPEQTKLEAAQQPQPEAPAPAAATPMPDAPVAEQSL